MVRVNSISGLVPVCASHVLTLQSSHRAKHICFSEKQIPGDVS